ncbi:MAG: response regulator transcription factor [Methylobacterium sp.]|uniref:response regulator n=1 Tax=Methylobacterium sp. TaxID=409 RepID=UPI0025DAE78E|nr:response regulator transcription factor [Methylobacterium sp.]MBX9932034.1 response regulator transcription factor [Methylobacterium sp.]
MTARSEKPIRVVLSDDHPLFLEGVRSLLEIASDIDIVGEANSGARALRLITDLKPDVAVLDISMPSSNGISVTKQLVAAGSPTRVVILSFHDDRTFVREALDAGARGYVLKRSAGENLLQAIRSTYGGGLYLDPAITEQLLPPADSTKRRSDRNGGLAQTLTDREREVIRLIALGFTNKEVAGKLGVTAKSVETYKLRASEKLELHTRTKIVQYAVLQGWFRELPC